MEKYPMPFEVAFLPMDEVLQLLADVGRVQLSQYGKKPTDASPIMWRCNFTTHYGKKFKVIEECPSLVVKKVYELFYYADFLRGIES